MPRKKLITFSILGTLTVASAAFFWYGWYQLLLSPYALIFGGGNILQKAILFAAGATIFLAFLSLINLLVDDTRCRIAIFSLVSFVIFPIFQFELSTLVVAFFFFLALLFFSARTKKQIKEHLRFSADHLFGPTLGSLLTLVSIIFAVQYFFAAQLSLPEFKFEIPAYIFDQTFKIIQDYIPGNSFEPEVKGSQIQIPSELIPYIEKGEFPPEIAAEIQKYLRPGVTMEQAIAELQKIVKEQGGIINVTEEEMKEVEERVGSLPEEAKEFVGNPSENPQVALMGTVQQIIESQINQIIEPYKKYLPAVFAVLAFVMLKWFGSFVNLFSTWLLAILTKILLLIKIAKVETETVQAERIVVE